MTPFEGFLKAFHLFIKTLLIKEGMLFIWHPHNVDILLQLPKNRK